MVLTDRLRHAQTLRAEAEKVAEALREELERTRRAATERAAEDAAAHEAAVARLAAEHDRAQVRYLAALQWRRSACTRMPSAMWTQA